MDDSIKCSKCGGLIPLDLLKGVSLLRCSRCGDLTEIPYKYPHDA